MARPRRTSAASDTSSLPDQNQELGSMYDYLAKIILLGPSGTGKSCLLHRFVKSEWRILSSQTIGVEFSSKIVKVGSSPHHTKRIKLQLWDTAGTERFRSVSRSYYRGAAGAILVYDVANLASFQALPTFLSDARALASPQVTVALAGNKADLVDGSQSQPQSQAQSQSTSRSKGIHINGSAHSYRLHKEDDRDPGGGGNASSASSGHSYLPYDSSSLTSSLTSDPLQPKPRSRTDTLASLPLPTHLTASTSPYGREVPPSTASHYASKAHIPYVTEVSALTGDNVDALFYRLAAMILTKIELGEVDPDDPASGIQYGDGSGGIQYGDGSGGMMGMGVNDRECVANDGGGTLKRRKGGNTRRGGMLNNLGEWEDVFRGPASRRCC